MSESDLQYLLQLLEAFGEYQRRQTVALERLAFGLEQLVPKATPSYTRSLESFVSFDWASIGATVVQRDRFGAAVVSWGGHEYTRRSPQNKFGDAIWFSRANGRDENGNLAYERLITFKKQAAAEAVPERTSQHLASLPSLG